MRLFLEEEGSEIPLEGSSLDPGIQWVHCFSDEYFTISILVKAVVLTHNL